MIPKASQRAGGQDLATHLLNALDNEFIEVGEVRGAIADDLHGAFAEWEVLADGLTRCREYLYSLSINPAPGQELTREQYLDYAARVEKKLGLEGQPRAMVFHIKEGREHCHVVWSRIDWQAGKAIHLAFDHEKLMMVSREFARDHRLELPDGYRRDGERDKSRRQSLYETQQQRQTGLTKEERMLMVTHAYRQSDSARAFVRALEAMGYVLATGKRPYVLVDIYGTMNALPKLIDDRSVRTKDIRAFLEKDYPPESLPTVEEARALVADLRKAREQFAKAQDDDRRVEKLEAAQALRRAGLVAAQKEERARHREERGVLERDQLAKRRDLKAGYLAQMRGVRAARYAARPTGLAAFLGRVTGVAFVIHKLHRHRDAQAFHAYRQERERLLTGQKQAALGLQRRQELQAVETSRQLKALAKVEARERQALDVKKLREQRVRAREDYEHMPALNLELRPKGRGASIRRAKDRFRDRSGREEREAPQQQTREPDREERGVRLRDALGEAMAREEPWAKPVDLAGDFARASGSGDGDDGRAGEEDKGLRVSRSSRPSERSRGRERGRRGDFERER